MSDNIAITKEEFHRLLSWAAYGIGKARGDSSLEETEAFVNDMKHKIENIDKAGPSKDSDGSK